MKKILVDENVLKQAIEALRSCLGMLERANCSTGYCCCGSAVDKHSFGDGHSPVDEGDYFQRQAIELARAAINKVTEQPKESLPDNCNIYLHMECVECGHYQTVRGHRHNGHNYFGSGYDFCDKCGGLPEPIDEVTVDEDL